MGFGGLRTVGAETVHQGTLGVVEVALIAACEGQVERRIVAEGEGVEETLADTVGFPSTLVDVGREGVRVTGHGRFSSHEAEGCGLRSQGHGAVRIARAVYRARQTDEISRLEATIGLHVGCARAELASERHEGCEVPGVVGHHRIEECSGPFPFAEKAKVTCRNLRAVDVVDAFEAEHVAFERSKRTTTETGSIDTSGNMEEIEVRRFGRRGNAGHDEASP
jgi:hypothetical protein